MGYVTVTEVRLTNDLSYAYVYYTVLGNKERVEVTQEAYNNCIEQIEFYRNKREQSIQENDLLQKQIQALLANDANADVSTLQVKIAHNEQLDEEYGAKMHELTIQRNLLEP